MHLLYIAEIDVWHRINSLSVDIVNVNDSDKMLIGSVIYVLNFLGCLILSPSDILNFHARIITRNATAYMRHDFD